MTIALGKVGKGTSSGLNSITANWTGGGSSSNGSLLIALYTSSSQGNTDLPTTPSGWTLRASNVIANGTIYVYDRLNAPGITGLTITLTGSPDAAALDIVEFTGVSAADLLSSVATGAGATETTNSVTTTNSADILIGLFTARSSSTTPRTLSTPGAGYAQTQTNNQSVGSATCQTNYTTYQVVSGIQTAVTTTCAVNTSAAWQCFLYSYQATPTTDPSLTRKQRKRRLWRRIPRHSKRRRQPFAAFFRALGTFPFWKRRRRRTPAGQARRHPVPFHGDITPIAPSGQAGCFTITVSEALAATLVVSGSLAALGLDIERLATMMVATTDGLSATSLIEEQMTGTIHIICCH
jgi:hypothetical protein